METQLRFQWAEDSRPNREPIQGSPFDGTELPPPAGTAQNGNPTTSTITANVRPSAGSAPESGGPPTFAPLPAAVENGVFGMTETGPIEPDEDDVASITVEHANEMVVLLGDLAAVEAGLRTGCDPRTGKPPRTAASRARLAERLPSERARLERSYADALAVYAEAFGDEAAAALDAWVRQQAQNIVSK